MNEEDSDFVRIRVRGEFPRSGSSQLIPPDLVAKARRTKAQGFEKLPIIMAADVARFGDDQTVIGMRQGRKFQILGKYRSLDTRTYHHLPDKHSPDAVVVDGDGLGAGVVDQLGRIQQGPLRVPWWRTPPRLQYVLQHVLQPPQ
jgi:hypothetical protein